MTRASTLGFVASLLACAPQHGPQATAASDPTPLPCPDTVVITPGSVRSPRPRLELVPPARGAPHSGTYKVTMFVLPNGHVDPSRVTVVPPLPSSYERAFKETVQGWRFWPATFQGCAVPATFDYELRFY